MRRIQFLGWGMLLCSVLLLNSCYPRKEVYFAPIASGGIVVQNDCHEQYGVPGTIKFQLDKVRLWATIDIETNVLTITATVEQGTSFFLRRSQFVVESNGLRQEIASRKVTEYGYTYKSRTRRIFQLEDGLEMQGSKTYFIEFDRLPTEGDLFTFRLPPLLINGIEHEIPVITFRRSVHWYIAALIANC